jgi:hypothetical protein
MERRSIHGTAYFACEIFKQLTLTLLHNEFVKAILTRSKPWESIRITRSRRVANVGEDDVKLSKKNWAPVFA